MSFPPDFMPPDFVPPNGPHRIAAAPAQRPGLSRRNVLIAGGALAATLPGPRARAQSSDPVDLELILAVDASRSIDAYEQELQMRGYARAFTDSRVIERLQSGPVGAIAVTLFVWSDSHIQEVLVPWTKVSDARSARALSDLIMEAPRRVFLYTSVSGAIDYSVKLFGNEFEGTRRVIDVSGDGVNNSGRPSGTARDEAVEQGITINGVAIMNERPNPMPLRSPPLDEYYEQQVIGGQGCFLVTAEGFDAFEDAIRRKIIREVS